MNLSQILFTMVAYGIISLFIVGDTTPGTTLELPTFDIPDFTFESYGSEGSCGTFDVGECIEFLGRVMRNIGIAIRNIGIGIIGFTQLIFNLVVYIVELSALVLTLLFTGVDGAPWYVNIFITLPFIGGIGLITYKLVRSGDSDD